MPNYIEQQTLAPVPQNEPVAPNQIQNNAGGYTFQVGPLKQLERWLILGSEGGTYYATERKLTLENVQCLKNCLNTSVELGIAAVDLIVDVSDKARAPKVSPAIYALASATASVIPQVRTYALSALPKVCRTGSHILEFARYVNNLRGWGRGLKNAVAKWYTDQPTDALAYQLIKYQQRERWSQRDLLRLSHPKSTEHNELFRYVTQGEAPKEKIEIIEGFELAKKASLNKEMAKLIESYGLTHEMIPSSFKNQPEVQWALLQKMPLTAMIRNLGSYTQSGLIAPLSDATKLIVNKLSDESYIHRSRVHPVQILVAQRTYQQGRGVRGSGQWTPDKNILAALESAFYMAFNNVEPTGRNFYVALDVSGSMSCMCIGVPNLSCAEAGMALAMVALRTEPYTHLMGFSHKLVPISVTKSDSLRSACDIARRINFGGTDCAAPMVDAAQNKLSIDTFVVITDNETWAGRIHPHKALEAYRQASGKNAALIVIGMVANKFTIADPSDPKQIDVVGFDTTVPGIIREVTLA